MTYLGIILHHKLNWSLHIKTKVSKAIKCLAMIKPAIQYMEVILNQKPYYLEIEGVAIQTFIRIKDEFQNNIWDGVPLNARANSHLRKLISITTGIKHEGQPLAVFVSDNLKNPYFNWNPPARNALVAMCENDFDDQNKIDHFDFCESISQNNIDCILPADPQLGEHSVNQQQQLHDNDVTAVSAEQQLEILCDRQLQQQHDNDVAVIPAEQKLEVHCDRQQQLQHDKDVAVVPAEQQLEALSDRQQQHDKDVAVVSAELQLKIHSDRQQQHHTVSVLANYRVEEYLHVNSSGQGTTIDHPGEKHSQLFDCNNTPNRVPAGISKITQLTIDLFDNNYHQYACKISCPFSSFEKPLA